MIIARYIAVVVIGYLLGSIPFGLLIGKRSARIDIRQIGSGKTGATNVLRVAGKKAAAMVVIADASKAALAVVFARFIISTDYLAGANVNLWWVGRSAQVLAALAALFGHTWPVFVKFKGGRGVASFFGGLLAMCPLAAIFGTIVLSIAAGLTRYVSLGSIAGTVATYTILVPLIIWNKYPIEYLGYSLLGTLFIAIMHRDNIVRLVTGKERRLGEKAQLGNQASSANPEN